MSRKRYLSTNISVDPKLRDLAQISEFAALLYTWMIPHADDAGCIAADNDLLLMQVVPGFRWRTVEDVASAIDAMVGLHLVEREGTMLRFPQKTFYKYQAYIGSGRRGAQPEPEPTPPSEPRDHPRTSAQNGAMRNSAPFLAQNHAPSSSSFSSSGVNQPAGRPAGSTSRAHARAREGRP